MNIVQSARELCPRIQDAASQIEREGRLPADVVGELVGQRFFRLLGPAEIGGAEASPLLAARAVAELSAADGSTGWCSMIASQWSWLGAYLPLAGANEVFGDPSAVVAGSLRPGSGVARPAQGGYRVAGRWAFASGCLHSQWLAPLALVERDGAPAAELIVALLPRQEAEIVDNWDTIGLSGTGSHDFAVDDVFVPQERVFRLIPLPQPSFAGALYRGGVMTLPFVLQAGQALGVAAGALQAFLSIDKSRTRQRATAPLLQLAETQRAVAEAHISVNSAWAYVDSACGSVWAALTAGTEPPLHSLVEQRLAVTHAITAAYHAVDILHRAAGSDALASKDPLDRRFRDLRAAIAHVQASNRALELSGQVLLGTLAAPAASLPYPVGVR